MYERDQLVEIEEHPAPPRSPREDVALVLVVAIPIIRERDEFVSQGVRELPHTARERFANLPRSSGLFAPRSDPYDGGKERLGDFLLGEGHEFGGVRKKRSSVAIGYRTHDTLRPREMRCLEEDLDKSDLALPKVAERAYSADQRIDLKSFERPQRQHKLSREAEIDDKSFRPCRCVPSGMKKVLALASY